jgi:hypothetical protein
MKKYLMALVLSLILMFSFIVIGCEFFQGFVESDIYGTWEGFISEQNATVIINASGWSISIPGIGFTDSGTYTITGKTASLKSNNISGGNVSNVGHAEYINNNTIHLTLDSNSIAPGTYTLTRK